MAHEWDDDPDEARCIRCGAGEFESKACGAMTRELLEALIDAVYRQQQDATGLQWGILQRTLGRLQEMAYGDGEQASVVYDPADAAWAAGVARLHGLPVGEESADE